VLSHKYLLLTKESIKTLENTFAKEINTKK